MSDSESETDHEAEADLNPAPYDGEIDWGHWGEEPRTVVSAATFFEYPPLRGRVGAWAICDDGLASLRYEYWIDRSRVDEPDWVQHMSEKEWVDVEEFSRALERARALWSASTR